MTGSRDRHRRIPNPTEPVTPARLLGAIGAAAAMQLGSLVAAFAAFVIWVLAATEDLFTPRDEMATFGWLAVPTLLGAVALWIGSGAVAATILRRRAGWLTLLMLPAMPTVAGSLAALL